VFVNKEFNNNNNRKSAQRNLANPFHIPTFVEKGLPHLVSFLSHDDVKKMRCVSKFFLEFLEEDEEDDKYYRHEFDYDWYLLHNQDSFDFNKDDSDEDESLMEE
jgi:hypothetical protein